MGSQRSSKLARTGAAVLVMAAAIAVGACGSNSSTSSGGKKIGLAQTSSRNDHSFGQATHEGAVQAQKQLGVKLTEVENLRTPRAQASALQNLARSNDLVVMVGEISSQGVSAKFPETQFVILDGRLPQAPNNHSVFPDWKPVGYLAGVVAATVSKTRTVGFIGGVPIPVILDAQEAFIAGAKSVDLSVKVVRTTIGSFTDSAKGKAAANAQIAAAADVLYADLDTAHTGIVQAAKQSGKDVKVIGSVAPKCDISSGIDIGDTILDQAQVTYSAIKQYVDKGKLPPSREFGLEGGNFSFRPCPGAPASVKKAVATTTKGLISGKIDPG